MITKTEPHTPAQSATTLPRLAVVMTVFNRREKTLQCLENLSRQTALNQRIHIDVFLMDDGSRDGTSEAIREQFPAVNLLKGDGNLFWNGGMSVAFGKAIEGKYDFYLWLNDDTFLYSEALDTLLDCHQKLVDRGEDASIVIGGTIDPETGEFSYGGFQKASKWTLKLLHVQPGAELKQCTTMCGNCVLIPKEVVNRVGNIEGFYTHRWGDTDYGLRTRYKGGKVWIAPGYIGTCEANPLAEAWTDTSLSFKERIKDFHSIKGYIKKDWYFYVKRHGGILWPLLWMKPYIDIAVTSLKTKLTGSAKS
ncbi:MAG: glycosyltransferase family 2 protein [Bacteroidota bacterium]